jgi:hypothetical protein
VDTDNGACNVGGHESQNNGKHFGSIDRFHPTTILIR